MIEREYHEHFSGAMERWLDAGHGLCALRQPDCAELLATALNHFDGERCHHFSWVIMPNHVHLLFVLQGAWTIEKMIHSWKLYSARRINSLLGRTGPFWQRDYFDRLVRDREHFNRCVRYIRRNPRKAKLREGEYLLYESDFVREIR